MQVQEQIVARMYLKKQESGRVVLGLPGTNYQLHLRATGEVAPTPQGRVRGVIRLPVWKLDDVTAGGAFIEPVYGTPRRVQGRVTAVMADRNAVVVEVCGQPIVGELPGRWNASQIPIGSRVGLDIPEGGVFDPLTPWHQRELGVSKPETVNLSAEV